MKYVLQIVLGMAFAVGACYMLGCQSNGQPADPVIIVDDVGLAADLAESYVILFQKPGPDRDKLVEQIDTLRKAADLPALRRLLERLRPTTQPTTQAVK